LQIEIRKLEISYGLSLPPSFTPSRLRRAGFKSLIFICYLKCKNAHLRSTNLLKLCALHTNSSSVETLQRYCLSAYQYPLMPTYSHLRPFGGVYPERSRLAQGRLFSLRATANSGQVLLGHKPYLISYTRLTISLSRIIFLFVKIVLACLPIV